MTNQNNLLPDDRKFQIAYFILMSELASQNFVLKDLPDRAKQILGHYEITKRKELTEENMLAFIQRLAADSTGRILGTEASKDPYLADGNGQIAYTIMKVRTSSEEKKLSDLKRDIPTLLKNINDLGFEVTVTDMWKFARDLYSETILFISNS